MGEICSNKKYVQFGQYVETLRAIARDRNLSEQKVDFLFDHYLTELESKKWKMKQVSKTKSFFQSSLKVVVALAAVVLLLCVNYRQQTSRLVLRNVQNYIYPSLKVVRILAVPILRVFPTLSELYDESCLVGNPYFQVSDMECWPCENVHSVLNLTGYTNQSLYQSGVPYLVRTNQAEVKLENVLELYAKNSAVFERDAPKLHSTCALLKTSKGLLKLQQASCGSTSTHILWRINRLLPAQIIRALFPRPTFLPDRIGQATERFVLIDGPEAEPYVLPYPECSYVFLVQGSGTRTIVLRPTRECSGLCRPVSVILSPSEVLWFNWWYWRPLSLPSENSTQPSLSYMNSYC